MNDCIDRFSDSFRTTLSRQISIKRIIVKPPKVGALHRILAAQICREFRIMNLLSVMIFHGSLFVYVT